MTASFRRAVVIGVNNYSDPTIAKLRGARNDAVEIYEHLRTSGNFKVEDHHLLLDEEASALKIRRAISDLLWKTEESELSLLYFSGHGLTDAYGNGFLAPYDMDKSNPLVCGIRMQELRELMLAAKNKKTVLLILDCCYSGIASEGEKEVTDAPGAALGKCFAPLDKSKSGSGIFIFASAGSDERSRELAASQHRLGRQPPHPHGVFSFQILEGLDGRASTQGHEITLGSLVDFVNNSSTFDGMQVPALYCSDATLIKNIYVSRASRQKEFERQLQEVRDLLEDEKDLHKLFKAINTLGNVLGESPALDENHRLRSVINARLASLHQPASEFLLFNVLDLPNKCEGTVQRLQDAVHRDKIDFTTITAEEESFRNLIMGLFEVASGQAQQGRLQHQITTYHNWASRQAHLSTALISRPDVTHSIGS